MSELRIEELYINDSYEGAPPPLRLVEEEAEFTLSQVDFALARGPYVGRLLAQETLLDAAEELPYEVYEAILDSIEARQTELNEFDMTWTEIEQTEKIKRPALIEVANPEVHPETGLSESFFEESEEELELPERSALPKRGNGFSKTFEPPVKPVVWPPQRKERTEQPPIKQRFSPTTGLPILSDEQLKSVRIPEAPQRSGVYIQIPHQGSSTKDREAVHWSEKALCAQTDPEAFYPEKGGSTREAKKVCLTCEVRGECLQFALDNDERFGIAGGLSERERRKLKKRLV